MEHCVIKIFFWGGGFIYHSGAQFMDSHTDTSITIIRVTLLCRHTATLLCNSHVSEITGTDFDSWMDSSVSITHFYLWLQLFFFLFTPRWGHCWSSEKGAELSPSNSHLQKQARMWHNLPAPSCQAKVTESMLCINRLKQRETFEQDLHIFIESVSNKGLTPTRFSCMCGKSMSHNADSNH